MLFVQLLLLAVAAGVLLWLCVCRKKKLNRLDGGLLLSA